MSTAGLSNEVLLNASHIMEACKDATSGNVKVTVYDRLLYHVCPDPKNAPLCKVVEEGYLRGEFVAKQDYWLTDAQYASNDFWLTPRHATSVVFSPDLLFVLQGPLDGYTVHSALDLSPTLELFAGPEPQRQQWTKVA